MNHNAIERALTGLPLALALALATGCGGAAETPAHEPGAAHAASSAPVAIPASMKAEHEAIHGRLVAATRRDGPVGDAARELATILHPHFVREEEIALPPLGLLAPLARGESPRGMADVLPLTDALRAELPRMLEEHAAIGAAARRLEEVARTAGDAEVEDLARALQLHARTEEEIFYPAAVLVGELVRERLGRASAGAPLAR